MTKIKFTTIIKNKKVILVFIFSIFLIIFFCLSIYSRSEKNKTENFMKQELKITAERFKKDVKNKENHDETETYKLFEENNIDIFYFDPVDDELYVLIPNLTGADEKNNFMKTIEKYIRKNQYPDLLNDLKVQSVDSLSSINICALDKSQLIFISFILKKTLLSSVGSKYFDNDVSRIRRMFEYVQILLIKSQEKVIESFYILFSVNKNIITVDSFENSAFSSSERINVNKREVFSFRNAGIAKNSFYLILASIGCKVEDYIHNIRFSGNLSKTFDHPFPNITSSSSVISIENSMMKGSPTSTNYEKNKNEQVEGDKKNLKNIQPIIPHNKDFNTFEQANNYGEQQKEESNVDNHNNLAVFEISSNKNENDNHKREIKYDENGQEIKASKISEKPGSEINPNANLAEKQIDKTEEEEEETSESKKSIYETEFSYSDDQNFSKISHPAVLSESDNEKSFATLDDYRSIDEENKTEFLNEKDYYYEEMNGLSDFHRSCDSTMNEERNANSMLSTHPELRKEFYDRSPLSTDIHEENLKIRNRERKISSPVEILKEKIPITRNIKCDPNSRDSDSPDYPSEEDEDEPIESGFSDDLEEHDSYESNSTAEMDSIINIYPDIIDNTKPLTILRIVESDDSDEKSKKNIW